MIETKFAPYAPPSAVLAVIEHYRNRDVPEYISPTNLMQIGVTDGLVSRTLAALRFLGLVREDGTTTDQLVALRYAKDESEFQEVLGGILSASYKDALDHMTVESADDQAINRAFIPYSPAGQRGRMITLFLALAQAAGWRTAVQAKSSTPRKAKTSDARPSNSTKRQPQPSTPESPPSAPTQAPVQVPAAASSGLAFGIAADDFAELPDEEFEEVWAALGKLARAKAKAAKAKSTSKAPGPFDSFFSQSFTPKEADEKDK